MYVKINLTLSCVTCLNHECRADVLSCSELCELCISKRETAMKIRGDVVPCTDGPRLMLARTRITENRLHTPAAAARAMSGVGNNTVDIDEYHHTENDRYLERGVVPSVRSTDYLASVYAPYDDEAACNGYKSCGGCAGYCTCRVGRVIRYGK